MTRIDSLGAFVKQWGDSESNSGAPLVFWDGYGFHNLYSGIAQHALRMLVALEKEQVHPILLGSSEVCESFKDHFVYPCIDSRGFGKLQDLKIFWPQIIGTTVENVAKGAVNSSSKVILHGLSNFNIPIWPKRRGYRRVLTVHDIIPLLEPGSVSMAYFVQLRAILGRALRMADGIVCVSSWTRRKLLERYPMVEHKTHVIQNGVEPFVNFPQDFVTLKDKGNRPEFLCISRYEKYKNLELLVDILELLPTDWHGVLVTDSRGEKLVRGKLESSRRQLQLKIVSDISDSELKRLYRTCHVYVHPSRLEGFCLPIAEALVAGMPVVYQKGSAIDELVSDKVGVGLDQIHSAKDWALAVETVSEFRQLSDWDTRLQSHRSTLPTWAAGAQRLKSLYNTLG
jgi:glycosyltransferase involved in cell wall biosynthesis